MFKKLLNVGKGHSHEQKLLQEQQQQQQQRNLFQLNEIRSYGFSHLNCLGYSSTLSLLAVGSKHGLVRVLGKPSVEFSYQLESGNSIRQIEFIDCRKEAHSSNKTLPNGNSKQDQSSTSSTMNIDDTTAAKLVVLTDNGQLHLFRLNTVRPQNFADNTTQTDNPALDCCKSSNGPSQDSSTSISNSSTAPEYTKLERAAVLDFFRHKPEDEDRSKRVTTLEISADGGIVFVGTEGGNVYMVPLDKFELVDSQLVQHQTDSATVLSATVGQRETGVRLLRNVQNESSAQADTSGVKVVNNTNIESSAAVAVDDDDETTAVNLNDEPTQSEDVVEPFSIIEFERHISSQLDDETIKSKKQGAVESIKRHPSNGDKLLLSYHRGLSVIFNVPSKSVEKYFYHNQVLESSCFSPTTSPAQGSSLEYNYIYTSHNDGSYVKWDMRQGNQSQANEDLLGQLYGPYPCKPTPKIQACTGLANDQLEELIIFSGGMPRATYDDKNPVTIVRTDPNGKDTIKTVLDFTSKVLDFVVITRPRGNVSGNNPTSGTNNATSGGGKSGGKKNKNKQQQQHQQQQQQLRNQPIAVALAILAEEEFVVIDLLDSETYLEFPLPYLNCVHSSAITCNQHYSEISDELYEQLLTYNRQQLKGKSSPNEWPISGGKVIEAPEIKSHDILLTGHEDGSVDIWDVSDLSMRHLLHLSTARFFSTNDDELVPIDNGEQQQTNSATNEVSQTSNNHTNQQTSTDNAGGWPPLKRVGRFDPYSDDTRLAVRRLSLCPRTGTLIVAGTGGQVLVFELNERQTELGSLAADTVTIVSDQRFTWKGRERLQVRSGAHKQEPGYQLCSYVQLDPPVSTTSIDLRSDWHLFAVGTSYGFLLYDYANKSSVVQRCTLNVQDFAIVSGDAAGAVGAMSRKKSFRKSLRESFRRLRRGRSQRNLATATPVTGVISTTNADAQQQPATQQRPAFSRVTTGVRTLNSASGAGAASAADGGQQQQQQQSTAALAAAAHRNLYSAERQVEQKVELSSIVKCITLTSAVIGNNTASFKPSLWVGTNSGQVLVYAIELATAPDSSAPEVGDGGGERATVASAPATSARLAKEIQLKHRAPIVAIFTSPEAPPVAQSQQVSASATTPANSGAKSAPETRANELLDQAAGAAAAVDESKQSEAGESAARLGTPDIQTGSKLSLPTNNKKGSPASASNSGEQSAVQHASVQPRVLICSEEQFKVFNLPNLKPFCKFKLTAHEGLRAKKISITQFMKPPSVGGVGGGESHQQRQKLSSSKSLQSFATQTSPPASPVPPPAAATDASDSETPPKRPETSGADESNNNSPAVPNSNHATGARQPSGSKELLNAKFGANNKSSTMSDVASASASDTKQTTGEQPQAADEDAFEPYMVCMSNQGDCAIYSVPELKRQAQIQVCKREDINGITSTMLTNYGEGYYLKSSSNFLRFSISSQRVLRVLSVV